MLRTVRAQILGRQRYFHQTAAMGVAPITAVVRACPAHALHIDRAIGQELLKNGHAPEEQGFLFGLAHDRDGTIKTGGCAYRQVDLAAMSG